MRSTTIGGTLSPLIIQRSKTVHVYELFCSVYMNCFGTTELQTNKANPREVQLWKDLLQSERERVIS